MGSDYEGMRAERDRLKAQLEEMRLESGDWRRKTEYAQWQVQQLQQQLQESERLRADAFQACETMRQELAAVTLERDEWKTGAEYAQQQVTQLRQQVAALEASLEDAQSANKVLRGMMANRDQEVAELQAQLEAAAVTPAQLPDSNTAERLERVQRLIGEVCGWYKCVEWFDDVEPVEAWEQVGALLGRLQREAD